MKKYWLIILGFVFVSCENIIDLPIEEVKSQYVVNGILYPDSVIRVYITKSISLTDSNAFPAVNSAKVLLYENNAIVDTLKSLSNGEYQSEYKSKPLKYYFVKILTTDNTVITALDSVPALPNVDTIALARNDSGVVLLNMALEDNAASSDIYLFRVFETREDGTRHKVAFSVRKYERALGMIDTSIVITDAGFNGQKQKLDLYFNTSFAKQIDLQVSKISKAYYLYLLTCTQNYLANENSGYERVPNYSNIQQGFGIWCAESRKEFVIQLSK